MTTKTTILMAVASLAAAGVAGVELAKEECVRVLCVVPTLGAKGEVTGKEQVTIRLCGSEEDQKRALPDGASCVASSRTAPERTLASAGPVAVADLPDPPACAPREASKDGPCEVSVTDKDGKMSWAPAPPGYALASGTWRGGCVKIASVTETEAREAVAGCDWHTTACTLPEACR